MVRVRLGVGVPALLCGYACLVAYPPLIAVFTLRVRHGEGLPAVYVCKVLCCGFAPGQAYPLLTEMFLRVRPGVGVPALRCGYACPVESPVDHLIVKVRVPLHQGVPAQYPL